MVTPITKVSGIGAQTAEILVENGFESAEVLAAAKEEDLLKISGFGPSKAKKFIAEAQALVDTDAAAKPPASKQSTKVEVEAETETVAEAEDEIEKPVSNVEKSNGPKLCPQKFAKAKKKKDKGGRAKKKKKKSSRKKKSK